MLRFSSKHFGTKAFRAKIFCTAAMLLTLFPFSASAQEAFFVTDYSADVNITDARVYNVNETIDVIFTEERHGIKRHIPLTSSVEETKLSNAAVYGDSCDTYKEDGNFVFQIGDEDEYVYGDHSYNIAYSLVHIKDDATDGDYVYLNLIGNEWDTSIERARIMLKLPTDELEDISLTSGGYGASANSAGAKYSVNGSVVTVTADNLNNYEGITIKIKMPEGTFANAPDSFYPMAGALAAAFPAIALALFFAVIFLYFKFGRDEPLVPIVEFYPPDGMSPAEIGYVIDNTADDGDITSLIFFWASKGYLTYDQKKKNEYNLIKKKNMGSERPAYEQQLFNNLWQRGASDGVVRSTELKNNFYTCINAAQAAVPFVFSEDRTLMNKASNKFSIIGLVLSCLIGIIPSIVLGMICGDLVFGLFVATALCTAAVLFFVMVTGLDNAKHRKSKLRTALKVILILILAAILIPLGAYIMDIEGVLPFIIDVSCVTLSFLAAVVSVFIKKRTEYGQHILERVLGFKDFLNTAEKEKLEMLLEETPTYFYDILPYALALGVTSKWADKFKDLVSEPPDWYNSTYDDGAFRTAIFCGMLSNSMTRMRADMSSMPQSEHVSPGSFGGGGFSGGGSGGGGGSSW